MSFPFNTSQFSIPCTDSSGDGLGCWPQFSTDKRSGSSPFIETPSFKKPKICETLPNPRMPESINKVMPGTFFKTQLCMKFRLGNCINGDRCNYAHGIGEIQRRLPHRQELVRKEGRATGIWNRDHSVNSKVKPCRMFSREEECPYGERCNFLHEGLEKCREGSGQLRENSALSIGCTGLVRGYKNTSGLLEYKRFADSSLNPKQLYANPGFWRTRFCHKWELSGNCVYGEKCVFAHGQAELRKLHVHNASNAGKEQAPKTLPPVKDELPRKTGLGATNNQPLQDKMCSFKWKKLGKINGIYADWIDGLPLVHSSIQSSEG